MLPDGVHKVNKKLKSGVKTYYYAWRGGPRLFSDVGTGDFMIEYGAALQSRRTTEGDTLYDFVGQYLESQAFGRLSDTTKRVRQTYCDYIRLDKIKMPSGKTVYFHALNRGALEDAGVRDYFMQWRDQRADTPRAADMCIEALSVVLSYAMDRGKLSVNRALRIAKLYSNDRSDVVWSADEIESLCLAATAALATATLFAAFTGLRQSDCADITWDADRGTHLEWETAKTGKVVMVPILPELRALLDPLPRDADTILLNARGTKWTGQALGNAFQKAKNKAGIKDKRFHDLRGTFASRLIRAGVSDERTADILGWSKDRVSEIRRVYVDKDSIISDVLRQIAVNSPVNRKQKGL